MTKVMVFGTFDIVHPGHEYFLRKAKELGDELIVVIGRDKNVENVKGKPVNNEEKRFDDVIALCIADDVLMGNFDDVYQIIEDEKPDVICLGYDQNSYTKDLQRELNKRGLNVEVIRLNPYMEDKYKSSKLK